LQSGIEQVSQLTSGSKSGVELDSPSRDQLQSRRRNFKGEHGKELPWLKFNCSTGIAICEQYAICIADQNSNTVKGFAGSFKLETFKEHDKSFQHQKYVMAHSALLAPEDTPLAACMKKVHKKILTI
jgi:hypothetical protein